MHARDGLRGLRHVGIVAERTAQHGQALVGATHLDEHAPHGVERLDRVGRHRERLHHLRRRRRALGVVEMREPERHQRLRLLRMRSDGALRELACRGGHRMVVGTVRAHARHRERVGAGDPRIDGREQVRLLE